MGGRSEHVVEAGDAILLPRNIPHGFRVEAEDTQLLEINTPGGVEGFHIAAGDFATHDGLPEATPPDIENLMRHGAQYACHVQGPPVGTD